MTASMLFFQASIQCRATDTENGMLASSAQNQSAVSKTSDGSSSVNSDSFLSTFEKISSEKKPNQQIQNVGRGKSSSSSANKPGKKIDDTIHTPTGELDAGISQTTKKQEENIDNGECPVHPVLNLAEIVNLIEKLGYNDLVGGSGNSDIAVSNPIKAELDRLYRFLANSQMDKAASSMDLSVLGGRNDSQSINPADLDQLINKIVSGQETKSDRLKDGPVDFEKTRNPIQATPLNRTTWPNATGNHSDGEPLQQNLTSSESSPVQKLANDVQATKASDPPQRFSGEPVQLEAVNTEASLVSKMIQDTQVAKDNLMRIDDTISDELGGKVTKVDAASNNDSGLPGSQTQLAERAFDLNSLSRQTDTGQNGLKTQTLDQIVRKAVIYMKNGQQEAKIDLKPEFLGHVRMQVTTENQQVTVKILTEFGFVKEMVENSIHQLKADLQQQGLNVDKLEVVVANDADEHKHSHEKSGQAKNRQHGGAHTNPENQDGETRKREIAGDTGPENAGKATVDYFA